MRKFTIIFLLALIQVNAQDFPIVQIPEQLTKNADATIISKDVKVTIEDYDKYYYYEKLVIKVYNQNGDKHARAFAFYDNEQRIEDLEVKVYNSNGKQLDRFKKKDFKDQSAVGNGTLYSESRVKFLRYVPVTYPYTLVFESSYSTSDTAFLPDCNFVEDYGIGILKSTFQISYQENQTLRIKESNFDGFNVDKIKEGHKLKYSIANLEAQEKEPYSSGLKNNTPNVKFALNKFHLKGVDGEADSWKDYGKWIHDEFLVGQEQLPEATITSIKKLVEKATSLEEKIRLVYKYVQDNTRYISVQLGIGGWKPISATEVDRNKYGDCKGLTNYTKALLEAVGVPSYYTVVYAGRDKQNLDEEFPKMSGNHVILNVPLHDKEIYLECTSQKAPVNFLGTFTDDRNVLKVTPNGGIFDKTIKYEDKVSKQKSIASVSINKDGSLKANVSIESTGIQYHNKYGILDFKKEDQMEHYKEYWSYLNKLELDAISFSNDKNEAHLTEDVNLWVGSYLSKAGNQFLMVPNIFNRNTFIPKRVRNRKTDVVVKRGYFDEDVYNITLPKGYKIESLLSPVEIITPFGEYSVVMKKNDDGTYSYNRKLLIKSGVFPKEQYADFRAFRKKIAQFDNSKIIITTN
ncbi:DUF3857 domain-containing protein [Croceivirga radicis]|uniref:DUF3857 domain-containing protein n=1 Tax=Croceivirga radicis TaxID=1929488 RepID=UPI000255B412|nr:DUF3857 domain-containing protein [Croceivirga radicis]